MSDFLTATEQVLAITRRQAKQPLVQQKINATCQLISSSGRFPSDLWEETFSGAALTADSTIQHIALPERTRIAAYVQDPDHPEARISIVQPTYPIEFPFQNNIAYAAGTTLHVKLETAPTILNLGVYRTPAVLVADTDTNWILTDFFDLVTDFAAAYVLLLVGEKEIMGSIMGLAGQGLQIYLRDRITQHYGAM
jgi:hypothetical protein